MTGTRAVRTTPERRTDTSMERTTGRSKPVNLQSLLRGCAFHQKFSFFGKACGYPCFLKRTPLTRSGLDRSLLLLILPRKEGTSTCELRGCNTHKTRRGRYVGIRRSQKEINNNKSQQKKKSFSDAASAIISPPVSFKRRQLRLHGPSPASSNVLKLLLLPWTGHLETRDHMKNQVPLRRKGHPQQIH